MLIDTHCHLDFSSFDVDRDEVVARAELAGVAHIIVPSLDLTSVDGVLALAERYPSVSAAVGVHPNSAVGWQDEWPAALKELAHHVGVVAIGEIGLDYYRDHCPPAIQRRALELQLRLAHELRLPVILHSRESDADLLAMLASSPLSGSEAPGVLHSFSSSWDVARKALDLGFYLGFTGPVTYPKADSLRDVAARVPLDRLLVETDAPFLAPQARRGKRNEPAYVAFVAERIAEIRGMRPGEISEQTTANAIRLFGARLAPERHDVVA